MLRRTPQATPRENTPLRGRGGGYNHHFILVLTVKKVLCTPSTDAITTHHGIQNDAAELVLLAASASLALALAK
jgi:hypothetical protein